MSSRSLLYVAFSTVLLFLILTLYPFKKKHGNGGFDKVDPAFKEYISAYTSGYISNESSIRIVLTTEYAKPIAPGKPINENL